MLAEKGEIMIDLNQQLERWLDDESITHDQADRMRRSVATAPSQERERRIPLVTEILGYVGAALAFFAVAFLVADSWEELGDWAQAGLFAALTGILLAGGYALISAADPALLRLSSVLWGGAVLGLGGTLFVLLDTIAGYDPDAVWVAIGAAATVLGVVLLHRHHSVLQHVVLFGAVVTAVAATVALFQDSEGVVHGIAVWAVGLAWIVATRRRLLRPLPVGMTLGTFSMLLGAQMVMDGSDISALGLMLGLATAGLLATMGVVLREKFTIILGGVGIFWFVPQTMFHYLGEEAGGLVGVFISGLMLIGLAVWTGRHRSAA